MTQKLKSPETFDLVTVLHRALLAMIASDVRDLTARQYAVLLTCCTVPGLHTVRGLAGQLNVTKPVIVRAVDRLQALGLVERKPDRRDRRSILIAPTPLAKAFLRRLQDVLAETAAEAASAPVAAEPELAAEPEGA